MKGAWMMDERCMDYELMVNELWMKDGLMDWWSMNDG
jgi:hypothetical protein